MAGSDEHVEYRPIRRRTAGDEPAQRLPFAIADLAVTGLVIICELDDPSPENLRPSMSMKITQYLRLSDESMIRLDMDRGVTSSLHGLAPVVSWKRSATDVIAEALALVQDEAPEPDSFPWEAYAEAARLRGIPVDADSLRGLPHTVLLSDELARIHEF
jgi:hypothetical protein